MKTLLLNTHDIEGGAARACSRLHESLNNMGVDSTYLVQAKKSDDPTIIPAISKIKKFSPLLRAAVDVFPVKFYPNRPGNFFSPAIAYDKINPQITSVNPNIIHLHWICEGFIRIESLQRFRKPIIWTMHDMWPFTGGCHYDRECGKYSKSCGQCPELSSGKQKDLAHRIWNRKRKSWKNLDLTIASPSQWLADCAQKSTLFQNRRIEVIPNGINLKRYKPIARQLARDIWNLPQQKKLLLFGAMNATSDKRKGFDLLLPALQKFALSSSSNNVELIVLGASKPKDAPDLGMKTHYITRIHDDVSLSLLYAAADLFIAPSIQENLSNTVVEALACGTPSIAFNIGGMPDMIDHQQNGYLAQAYEPEDLAHGISWLLEDDERLKKLSAVAREKAVREFSVELMAQRYVDLYQQILNPSN